MLLNEIKLSTQYQEDEDVAVLEEIGSGEPAQLIVYNDDHNTFDYVIECFIDVLNHAFEQSEQLAMIIHFKGKATVKTAPMRVLKPFKEQLSDRGLSVVIEGVED